MKFEIDLNINNHECVQSTSKDIEAMLVEILTLLRSNIMLTVQDVLNAVTAEKNEVAGQLNALTQQVKDLQSVLVTGSQVTQADLQNIITSVEAIFTPNPVAGGAVGGGGIVGGGAGVVDAGGVGAGSGGGGAVAVPVDPTPIV